ncbi:hypothetical protein [Halobacillus litoralis]|uniref:hypothetical protein n=1 Tax=Halobacillus litoralis TaxID=45668 RepID=UPI00249273C8|nr:hypothetical protein [Halobacillus litoralis]
MKQIIHTWKPHEDLTNFISLDEFKQIPYRLELKFTLLDENGVNSVGRQVTFIFEYPFGVRYSEEADRVDIIKAELIDEQSVVESGVWPYFKVENSSFIKWQRDLEAIVDEDEKKLMCFGFSEERYLFEVLSYSEPKVEIKKM